MHTTLAVLSDALKVHTCLDQESRQQLIPALELANLSRYQMLWYADTQSAAMAARPPQTSSGYAQEMLSSVSADRHGLALCAAPC